MSVSDNKIIFVSDLFVEDFRRANKPSGGAELHDEVVLQHFLKNEILHEKINSQHLTFDYLAENADKIWFISNFSGIKSVFLSYIASNCKYVIYEHDYKFIDVRNPISFPGFIVPEKSKINISFYENARKVICLSGMHRNIFDINLGLPNIVNTKCSMWSDKDLEVISGLYKENKNGKFAVIESTNPIKKTKQASQYCRSRNLDFDLISSPKYYEFMKILSNYKGLVFMTGHPEPTPRIAIEAKMLGLDFISQKKLIGVANEEYFNLSGESMINKVREMRDQALLDITGWTLDDA